MSMLPDLSAEQILSQTDSEIRPLEVPEWKGTVYIRTISGNERDAVEYALEIDKRTGERRQKQFRAYFASLVLCDSSGRRLFQAKDVPSLGQKCGAAIERIVDEGLKLNKFAPDDVEQMVGNSPGTRGDSSGSASQRSSGAASESVSNE